jgi:Flp pilus assembly protein TadB
MLRFVTGILLVQLASVVLVVFARPAQDDLASWLPILVALGVIALVTAFWFTHIVSHLRRDDVERIRSEFAEQREQLRVKAERDKTRLIQKNHKAMAAETRKAHGRANLKVGVALAVAAASGVLMIVTNFVTLGLLLMTATGGALGGYLVKRSRNRQLAKPARRPVKTRQLRH